MSDNTDFEMEDIQEIIDDFLLEADELISSLDTNLVKLESQPNDLDLLNEIFRAAHTIKGTSSFLGLEQVTTLTHKMEDILNKLRKSEMTVTSEIMDILLESLDVLKALVENVRENIKGDLEISDLLNRLTVLFEGGSVESEQIEETEEAKTENIGGSFDVGTEDMTEIIDDFLLESDELVSSLDSNLVKLETEPENIDLLNEIFRAAHTIKGTSSFLGFDQITDLTHKMEDILNKLRKAELSVTPSIMDLLLESLDILKALVENVRENKNERLELDDIIGRLEKTFNKDNIIEPTPITDNIDNGEPAVDKDNASSNKPVSGKGLKKSIDQTIRVDVERLDTLMNMMGELVLGRNSMVQTVNNLVVEHDGDYSLEGLQQISNSINFITTELQMAVMKMRMQPIGKVFKKFPRLVRDLSRDTKKEIALEITGESTELDKSVIEEIGDPLVHIIRNSCDHGIESPEEREKAGKPRQGKIHLSADQEGSNIVIKIVDDGKGLDIEAIKQKAIERKLVSPVEVNTMHRSEIFRFIFEAGFSTAKKITDVSGRGVGMDVVRTNIEKLNGMIDLDSELGKGTTISIKLPLTLAIIQGLLVESDSEVFILPLSSVHETVKSDQSEIYYINKKPVLRLREDVIPIINLNEILKGNPSGFTMTEKPYIVVVGLAEKKIGIIIDRFLGQEEVVIKSLGNYLGTTEGVAGATILGDGRIRLIVDLIGLFNISKRIS